MSADRRKMKAAMGRAAIRAVFFGAASDVSDEVACATIDKIEEQPDDIRLMMVRAAGAELLRLCPPEFAAIGDTVADALDAVDDGERHPMFAPRKRGSIIGWHRHGEEDRLQLAEEVSLATAYAEGVLQREGLRPTRDAALALVVGQDRRGKRLKDAPMPPVINLAGRSWAVARRLLAIGDALATKKDRARWLSAGAGRARQTDDIEAALENLRSRFVNKQKAEMEFLRAGVFKRKTTKHTR